MPAVWGIAQRTVAARREGFGQLLEWARKLDGDRVVSSAILEVRVSTSFVAIVPSIWFSQVHVQP